MDQSEDKHSEQQRANKFTRFESFDNECLVPLICEHNSFRSSSFSFEAPHRVNKQQSYRPVGFWREYDEAKYVENGSIVPRSGTVKTTRGGELLGVKKSGGRDSDLYVIEPATGELHGFMLSKNCKQTMRNSSELA